MEGPKVASTSPYPIELKEGKKVFWCACGRSANQPFCDGSHKGTGFSPLPYVAPKDKIVFFCGCKHSHKAPLCDGTHVEVQQKLSKES